MLGKARISGLVLLVAAVAAVGLLVVRDNDDDRVNRGPVAAVDLRPVATAAPGPVSNARIVHGDDTWEGKGPPRLEGAAYPIWTAFDQKTGSFLYVSGSESNRPKPARALFVGQGGRKWGFACHRPALCEGIVGLGPDRNEVTTGASARFVRSLQVLASDGSTRESLDITEAVTNRSKSGFAHRFAAAAWSPDGRRLAVGTEPVNCDGRSPCEAKVWIFDRDGGKPQLVHAEPTPAVEVQHPNELVLTQLGWSPDGRSLGLVVAPTFLECPGVWPRLVALRFSPGRPVRAETLHRYDPCDWQESLVMADDFHIILAFAWSPDGTRVAVTHQGGIAEISADDGRILARRPGESVHGPLAWLRRR